MGIRQALEDEAGGVNDMVVGERRQFVVTEDTVLENIGGGKLFGVKLPPPKECARRRAAPEDPPVLIY